MSEILTLEAVNQFVADNPAVQHCGEVNGYYLKQSVQQEQGLRNALVTSVFLAPTIEPSLARITERTEQSLGRVLDQVLPWGNYERVSTWDSWHRGKTPDYQSMRFPWKMVNAEVVGNSQAETRYKWNVTDPTLLGHEIVAKTPEEYAVSKVSFDENLYRKLYIRMFPTADIAKYVAALERFLLNRPTDGSVSDLLYKSVSLRFGIEKEVWRKLKSTDLKELAKALEFEKVKPQSNYLVEVDGSNAVQSDLF